MSSATVSTRRSHPRRRRGARVGERVRRCSWPRRRARSAQSSSPKPGGSVTYGLESETGGGWCPSSARLAISGIEVGAAIYDTLMVPNTKNEMVPYLAESVEPNADFTEWKITLRDGITFHDGTPLDSAALVRNFEEYRKSTLIGAALEADQHGHRHRSARGHRGPDPALARVPVVPVPRRPVPDRGAGAARLPRLREQPHRHRAVQARPLDGQPGAGRQQEPRLLAEGRQGQAAPLPRQDHVQARRRGRAAHQLAAGRPARPRSTPPTASRSTRCASSPGSSTCSSSRTGAARCATT